MTSTDPSSVRARMAAESGLVLDRLSKRYGDLVALDGASITVEKGEFVTLLGPSGSGKTTCLRVIAGIVDPDSGSVRLAGRDILRVPMHQRNIGMVFQNYALFPHMSVADNVLYPLRMRRMTRGDAIEAVERALALVQLAGFASRRPHEISGGQQQRVALARALVFDPDLLLLDEPLSALDRVLREGMQLELRRIHRQTGATTICVTHDRSEALTMSDRVVILDRGRIVQSGTPQEVYRRPASRFVAEFLGEVTVLSMKVAQTDGSSGTLIDDAGRCLVGVRLPSETRQIVDAVVRTEVVGVRPVTSTDDPACPGARWTGIVREAVFLGDAVRYVIACEPHVVVARVPATSGAPELPVGTSARIVIDPSTVLVYPRTTPPGGKG